MKNSIPLGLTLLLLCSCHSADPVEEASKLNETFAAFINSVDLESTPLQRYSTLVSIREKADSLVEITRSQFKKKNWTCLMKISTL